ncbi:MAG: HDIG domain-containing protein [Actinobacteria bacterium]|nr:HDIG domain-containing protein [Actinomycetota bacterium]
MATKTARRVWIQRVVALVVALAGVPFLVALGAIAEDAPIREGETAPRTVRADQLIRIVDVEATDTARRTARESVRPQEVFDDEAQAATIAQVRDVFAAVRDAREPEEVAPPPAPAASPGASPAPAPAPRLREPSEEEQLAALRDSLPFLSEEARLALVELSDAALEQLENETISVAQQLARLRITEEELESTLDEQLRVELAVRNFPGETGSLIVDPLIRGVMQPTVRVDPDLTTAARDQAEEAVGEVVRTWRPREPIVVEGETVDAIQMQALRQRGLEGTDPRTALLRAFGAMALVVVVVATYLRQMQPRVWRSGRKILLLSALVAGYALLITGAGFLTEVAGSTWWYAVPAGALAMLTAILVAPVVGIATMLPSVALVLVVTPQSTAVAVFVAASVLVSVPLVTKLASRGDLRTAVLRAGMSFPVLAVVSVAVFGPRERLGLVALAGLVNGILTAVLVQGTLPFVETWFRLPTVTALLDLADRNHPLLRELEQKALGSYNHSVMVAALVERACRRIGANGLLGSVAALYHDIGKVRQPHFFIENQQGIANPHDDLEPEVSAVIIQNHVVDGVEMAREYRLPPEVVAAIGSHHGTMIVTYFYRQALDRAEGDIREVDVDHFRYKGTKPRSKEAAVLLMADCCEAATRAAAMDRGTLPRDEIEGMVDRLIQERVDDGQFDECDLTFAEMSACRDSIVEALVGIYHPRIAYPESSQEREPEAAAPERSRS